MGAATDTPVIPSIAVEQAGYWSSSRKVADLPDSTAGGDSGTLPGEEDERTKGGSGKSN